MTTEELLTDRYLVTAPYPSSSYPVGTILSRIKHATNDIFHEENKHCYVGGIDHEIIKLYPHLFKPLPWYAERKAEDLPEYVKYQTGEVAHVTLYELWANGDWYYKGRDYLPDDYWHLDKTTPATLEEYKNQT